MPSHKGRSHNEHGARDSLQAALERELARRAAQQNRNADLSQRLVESEAKLKAFRLRKEIAPPPLGVKEVHEKFKLAYVQFENRRFALFTALIDTASSKEKRIQAERGYVEARNDLLFMAVRHYQSEFPIQKDGTRGYGYQKQIDRLFNEFVANERFVFAKETNTTIDTVYTLVREPVLMEAFSTQMLGEYGLENTPETHARKTVIESALRLEKAKLSPEKQKRLGKLGTRLSKMKWGRNTLALLAILAAVSKDAPDVDVTPLHGGAPTEDVQSPRPQAPTERADESSASVSITISEGGNALTALKDVVIASGRISWITPWMETVRRNARPDLVVTREGRLEALAMNLGFMTDYTHFDQRTGTYVADSMPIPEGSTLVLDESGMRLVYNGREEQLVTVTNVEGENIITVHPYTGMRP